jgi:cysteine desulfurase
VLNQRLYLDYNSTSPLAKRVSDYLASGDLLFANPASVHTSGKKSKKAIADTTNFLKKTYSLNSQYDVYYHSGATEALNTFFQLDSSDIFVYAKADHPAVESIAKAHKKNDGEVYCLDISKNGELNFSFFNSIDDNKNYYLNFTWVNNETGIINNLDSLKPLIEKKNVFIHVDGVQSVGKFHAWNELIDGIDFISFSGHKFGALKGVGFSFVKSNFPIKSLVLGGGQQRGLRSGTENPLGVYSLKLALESLVESIDINKTNQLRLEIGAIFQRAFIDNGILIESNLGIANNTLGLIFKNIKSDLCLIQFDLAGIDVSYGSACSSGNQTETQSLKSLGLAEYEDRFIRLSFGPFDYKREAEILSKLSELFSKLKSL